MDSGFPVSGLSAERSAGRLLRALAVALRSCIELDTFAQAVEIFEQKLDAELVYAENLYPD